SNATQKESTDRTKATVGEKQKTAPQYPALFVETSKTQLAATLTALQKRELFLDLQPQFARVASVDIKNQSANLMPPTQSRGKWEQRAIQHRKFPFSQRKKGKEESKSHVANKKPDQQKHLGKKAKPADKGQSAGKIFFSQEINSYQMLVQMEKPVFSIPEKDRNGYRHRIGGSAFSPSNPVKENNKIFDQAKRQKKREVKKGDDIKKEKASSQKKPSHKFYSAIPSDGIAAESLKRLQDSQSVRVLFVFSKKKNRVNAASKAPRK
ncbi:hypothetical protein MNBD_PLANCTO02-2459, partial [hydrothermal vent metagenome]